MPISRLRLRLAASFGAALLAALLVLAAALLLFLRHEAEEVFDESLRRSARGLHQAIQIGPDAPSSDVAARARWAVEHWPIADEVVAVLGPAGELLALGGRGSTPLDVASLPVPTSRAATTVSRRRASGDRIRIAVVRPKPDPGYFVVIGRSTRFLHGDTGELIAWLAVALPLAAFLALMGGYFLAQRSLRPVRVLGETIDAIDPKRLAERLPVHEPPDEIDALALRFNVLLDQLSASREQARRFLATAAHQIKTPLTIVRGETGLALERDRPAAEYREALHRIRAASEQMSHRVNDLFLIENAVAGENVRIDEVVELDILATEVAETLRGRASRAGKRLELEHVEPTEARGNDSLLREALTELIENAVRYGDASEPVSISAYLEDGRAIVAVASRAAPASSPAVREEPVVAGSGPASTPGGLGLPIVRWIAQVHGGTLEHELVRDRNVYRVVWPGRSAHAAPLTTPA